MNRATHIERGASATHLDAGYWMKTHDFVDAGNADSSADDAHVRFDDLVNAILAHRVKLSDLLSDEILECVCSG